jgi:copper chaperone CopZ
MKSVVLMAIALLLGAASFAQIKNSKTATLKVYGNCGMCKTKIEKAGTQKGVSQTVWDEATGMATITYDTKKTTTDAVLKKIALVGYDSDSFLAPDNVYAKLHGCCKYERVKKTTIVAPAKEAALVVNNGHTGHPHSDTDKLPMTPQEPNPLQSLLDNYFALKDALVKSDAVAASSKAAAMLAAIDAVQMNKLKTEDHMAYMKVVSDLKKDAGNITASKGIDTQRDSFINLSKNMITLVKVAKPTEAVYVQHCPMANDGKGADWLSKENSIKNPYYGSMMLTCGKTVETIKQ